MSFGVAGWTAGAWEPGNKGSVLDTNTNADPLDGPSRAQPVLRDEWRARLVEREMQDAKYVQVTLTWMLRPGTEKLDLWGVRPSAEEESWAHAAKGIVVCPTRALGLVGCRVGRNER
jgi:hypothetical protein